MTEEERIIREAKRCAKAAMSSEDWPGYRESFARGWFTHLVGDDPALVDWRKEFIRLVKERMP